MTITPKPEQERILAEAMKAGLIERQAERVRVECRSRGERNREFQSSAGERKNADRMGTNRDHVSRPGKERS